MSLYIQNFRKASLTQDEMTKLCIAVSHYSKNIPLPKLATRINKLDNAINNFQALLHPVIGSELTPEVLKAGNYRSNLLVGFKSYIEYAFRHPDPLMVDAAREIKVVLDTPSYKRIYRVNYNSQSNRITKLVDELKGSHLAALNQLNILFYVDLLEQSNTDFDALYANRVKQTARNYRRKDVLKVRATMEKAFNTLCTSLEAVAADAEDEAAMGGTPTPDVAFYKDLFAHINEHIGNIVEAAKHRITMGKKAKKQQSPTAADDSENNS